MRVSTLIYISLRSNTIVAVGFNLPKRACAALGRLAFGHGGKAATCSLKAAANLVGPSSFSPQRLKSPCSIGERSQPSDFQDLRLLSCRPWGDKGFAYWILIWLRLLSCSPWPQAKRPRGLKGWPSGQTEPAKLAKGRANSEPQSVAPAVGRRPQKNIIL